MAKAPAPKKAAPKPKRAAPKADKAARPSPPDRDGDGAPGGSLKGNKTDEHAQGLADAALSNLQEQHEQAVAQIANDGTATIILRGHANGNRAKQPVGLNGKIRHLDIDVEVQVSAEELAVLEDSGVEYETLAPLAASAESADAGAGAEGSSSAPDVEQPKKWRPK
jgi:hypothetical protein